MRHILITGGSGKVGFQLVKHFLEKGFMVTTTSTDKARFFELKEKEFANIDLEHLKVIEVDFGNEEAINTILDSLMNSSIVLTDIVHNARSLNFLKIETDQTVSSKNFSGEFYMDVIFPYQLSMSITNKISHDLINIIFISSMYGVVAPTPILYNDFAKSSPIHYGVSKAAQIHLTKELAVRLAPDIRVNCVSFGGIKGRTDEAFEERYKSLNPQHRMLNEADVIGPVDFLVSDNAKSMTGQNIKVDGGWTIW